MKTINFLKKYGLEKVWLFFTVSLFLLTILGGCASAANKTTTSRTTSKADSSPFPDEDEDTDISPESKKRGKINLSKDKKTIFAQGWLETHELANHRTKKATKIVFRKDARILVDWNMDLICPPHLRDAPLVKEIEVEKGNPFLYEKDGMLIQRAGADFDMEYTTDRETLILCVPSKKGEIRIPEGVQDIYPSAFHECTGITSVFLPTTIHSIGDAAFSDMVSCTRIQAHKKDKDYFSKNGVLYLRIPTSPGSCVIAYPAGKTDRIYDAAPKDTDQISAGAFMGAAHLQEVYLPSGIKTIEDQAFVNCKNLRKVIVKNKKRISDLAGSAFIGCPKLKEHVKDKYER